MKLGNKLKQVRIENDLSMDDLRNLLNKKYDLNISRSMISRWENSQAEPNNTFLSAYAKEFNLDLNELLDISLPNSPNIIPLTPAKRIPILGEIACGEPILANENFDGYFLADPTIVTGDFVLRCDGDSMIDANIHDGDLVFIRQTPNVENGAITAVLIDDTATLKRFYKNDNQIILQPENKEYNPIIITADDMKDIKILGEMTGVFSARNR